MLYIITLFNTLASSNSISSSAIRRPMHILGPKPKGMKLNGLRCCFVDGDRIHRSGLIFSASSKRDSSLAIMYIMTITLVYVKTNLLDSVFMQRIIFLSIIQVVRIRHDIKSTQR